RRIFAAGLENSSAMAGWQVPPADMPKTPRWWTHGFLSPSGGTALLWDISTKRFELFRPAQTLKASGVRDLRIGAPHTGDAPIASTNSDVIGVPLFDGETNRVLWEHPCRACGDISASNDGSRMAQVGADGIEVYDTRSSRSLFHETRRVRPGSTVVTLSG